MHERRNQVVSSFHRSCGGTHILLNEEVLKMLKEINRRKFIKTSAAAGLAVSVAPNIILGQDDRRVRLGFIGVGKQGTVVDQPAGG